MNNTNNKRKMSKAAFNASLLTRRPVRNVASAKTLNGGKFIPSDDPPVITGCPWNAVIIDTTITFGKTMGYFKQSDLKKAATAQLGFNDTTKFDIEYRLISCSLWVYNYTAKSEFFRISVYPMSLVTGERGIELTRLESNAVKNKFAKIGYHYPLNHSSLVRTTSSTIDSELIAYVASEDGCSAFLHYKILWRGAKQGFAATILLQQLVWMPITLKPPREVREDDTVSETYENVELSELIDRMSIFEEKSKRDVENAP